MGKCKCVLGRELLEQETTGDVIDVVVIKPFEAVRTPCPPAGTIGQLYRFADGRACVRFMKPMTDTEGGVWPPSHDGDAIELQFEMDEIELVS